MSWPFKQKGRCQICGKHLEGKRLFTITRWVDGERSTYMVHKDCKSMMMRRGGSYVAKTEN